MFHIYRPNKTDHPEFSVWDRIVIYGISTLGGAIERGF